MPDAFPTAIARRYVALAALFQTAIAAAVLADHAYPATWHRAAEATGLNAGQTWALAATVSVGLAAWLAANVFATHDGIQAANDNAVVRPVPVMLESGFKSGA